MTTPSIDYLPADEGYRAGACNIGPAEIHRRRQAAVAAVAVTVAIAVAMIVADVSPSVRLLLAAPLCGAAVTIYQAVARFCVGYGMSGLTNFGALGAQHRVEDDAARRADRAKAIRAIAGSGLVAVLGGILFALLPLG